MTIADYESLFSYVIEGAVNRSVAASNDDLLSEPARLMQLLHRELNAEESAKLKTAVLEQSARYRKENEIKEEIAPRSEK